MRQASLATVRFSWRVFCLLLPWTIAGTNIAWGLLLAGLLAYASSGGKLRLGAARGALAWPLIAYLATCAWSVTFGVDPSRSLGFFHKELHKGWLYLLFSTGLAVEPIPLAPAWLAVGFTFASLAGITSSLWSLAWNGTWQRAHAFVHPVVFGEQAAIALLGISCFLLNPPKITLGNRGPVLARAFAGLAGAALLLSLTRAAWTAYLVGLASVGLLIPKWRGRILLSLPFALAIAICAGMFMGRMRHEPSLWPAVAAWRQSGGQLPSGGPLMRLALWNVAWRMGLDHPWAGVGLGNYRIMFRKYYQGPPSAEGADWGDAHNLFLHQFAERGVPGLAVLLIFWTVFWRRSYERARESPDAWNLWAFGTATAFTVMNLSETAFQTEIVWIAVFFIWLWTEARSRVEAGERTDSGGRESSPDP